MLLRGPVAATRQLDGGRVVVGDVTSTTALLNVDVDGRGPVLVSVTPDTSDSAVALVVRPDADDVARVSLVDLAPGRRHDYRIVNGDRTLEGHFVTAPPPDEAAPVRLLWSGDLGGHDYCDDSPYRVFDAMAARRPDLFVFAGDTVYADHPCPGLGGAAQPAETYEGFQARYRHTIGDVAVQQLLRQASVVAIWDDHEVRGDFSGPAEPRMSLGRSAFMDAWPIRRSPDEPGRLYRRLRWGALLEIFVLDTRQYRSRNWKRDGPDKTMLAASQREWLIQAVTASPARWRVIVSSVPLSLPKGSLVSDSWAPSGLPGYRTGFAHERDAILARLHAAGVQNLIVLTADVHFAAAMAHQPVPGFELWELVAGPLAAGTKSPWGPADGLNTRVLFSHGGQATFGELDVGPGALVARFFDEHGRRLWEHGVETGRPTRPSATHELPR